MVIDFGDLKQAANRVVERLDHTYLNDVKPFDEIDPSAENIAAYLYNEISQGLKDHGDILYSVSVYESDTSRATFVRD
jgi:6-pyruvoyltetrahydropterin/6-carboxytetrahydropterin synthase